jgi:hypothetical protein
VTPKLGGDLLPPEVLLNAHPKQLSLVGAQVSPQHSEIAAGVLMILRWLDRAGESVKLGGIHGLDEPFPALPPPEVNRAPISHDRQEPSFDVLDVVELLAPFQGRQDRVLKEVVSVGGRNLIPRQDRRDLWPEEIYDILDTPAIRDAFSLHRGFSLELDIDLLYS